jgi:hypothetical protein
MAQPLRAEDDGLCRLMRQREPLIGSRPSSRKLSLSRQDRSLRWIDHNPGHIDSFLPFHLMVGPVIGPDGRAFPTNINSREGRCESGLEAQLFCEPCR